jgi:hypothetical protein
MLHMPAHAVTPFGGSTGLVAPLRRRDCAASGIGHGVGYTAPHDITRDAAVCAVLPIAYCRSLTRSRTPLRSLSCRAAGVAGVAGVRVPAACIDLLVRVGQGGARISSQLALHRAILY